MQEEPAPEEPVPEEPAPEELVPEESMQEEPAREEPAREEPPVVAVALRGAVPRAVRALQARVTQRSATWAAARSFRHLPGNFVTPESWSTSSSSTSFATRSPPEPNLGKAATTEREPATSRRPHGHPERAQSWSVVPARIPTSAVRMNETMLWRLTRMPFFFA